MKKEHRRHKGLHSACVTVLCGVLTQYYFILFAGLTGLVFLVLKIKEKCGKDLIKYIIALLSVQDLHSAFIRT